MIGYVNLYKNLVHLIQSHSGHKELAHFTRLVTQQFAVFQMEHPDMPSEYEITLQIFNDLNCKCMQVILTYKMTVLGLLSIKPTHLLWHRSLCYSLCILYISPKRIERNKLSITGSRHRTVARVTHGSAILWTYKASSTWV